MNTNPDRHTVLCYRRKSMVKSASDMVSPQHQKDAVEALVRAAGFTIEWYEDVDGHRSGRYEDGRPGWLQLKAHLHRRDVAGVACYDLSRIYRNVREFLSFIDEIERAGLRLIVVKESIDTGNATGRAIVTMLMTIYQLESDLASERMRENIEYKRKTLGRHWGPTPFGCDRDTTTHDLIPDLATYPVPDTDNGSRLMYLDALRRCYELFSTGEYTYDHLATTLNQEGWRFKNRYGEPRDFRKDDIRRILAAWQLYSGSLPLGRQKDTPIEILEGNHEAILDPSLCTLVGAELAKRRHHFNKRHDHLYLMGGLAYCATCGIQLCGYFQDGQRRYRHPQPKGGCGEKWANAEVLEDELLGILSTLTDSPDIDTIVQSKIAALRLAADPVTVELHKLIEVEQQRFERLTDAYLDGLISKSDFTHRKREIEMRQQKYRLALPHSEAVDLEKAFIRARNLLQGFNDKSRTFQRRIVREIFARVEISSEHIVRVVPTKWIGLLLPLVDPSRVVSGS